MVLAVVMLEDALDLRNQARPLLPLASVTFQAAPFSLAATATGASRKQLASK
jgi:hypothetical protein